VLGHSEACSRCSKSKLKCDGEWPCSRCIKRAVPDACKDQEGVLPHASHAPVASDIIDTPAGSKPRTKPLKHAQACVQCSRSKVRCDGGRPCGRCVKRGLSGDCRRRQATSDCRVALVGAGGEEERKPHSVRKRALQSEWQDDFQLRANGRGINGLSSAGAAIPQQSAVVGHAISHQACPYVHGIARCCGPPRRASARVVARFFDYGRVLFGSRVAETKSRGHSAKHQLSLDPNPEGTHKNLDARRYGGREEQRIPRVGGGAGAVQGVPTVLSQYEGDTSVLPWLFRKW